MADEKSQNWVDNVSKLLIPVAIFGVGLYFTHQKDKSDEANRKFEQDSAILKLAASSNAKEQLIGLKMIAVLRDKGKFSEELRPVVDELSQGRPSDRSTQEARSILVADAKQHPAVEGQVVTTTKNQPPLVYLQIAREDQHSQASDLQGKLQAAGFSVPSIELVKPATSNTYIRYFSADDKSQADKALQLMKEMKFAVEEQNFSRLNQNNTSSGQLEIWIGDKYIPPTQP
jgi:hypothetical protein